METNVGLIDNLPRKRGELALLRPWQEDICGWSVTSIKPFIISNIDGPKYFIPLSNCWDAELEIRPDRGFLLGSASLSRFCAETVFRYFSKLLIYDLTSVNLLRCLWNSSLVCVTNSFVFNAILPCLNVPLCESVIVWSLPGDESISSILVISSRFLPYSS